MALSRTGLLGAIAVAVSFTLAFAFIHPDAHGQTNAPAAGSAVADKDTVTINEQQAKHVSVITADLHTFTPVLDAVGYIDFDQDHVAPVFSPWQGRVLQVFVKAGDDVAKGQALFTVESTDLVQAESNLISAAGVLELADKTLDRARKMGAVQASAEKDIEQAMADQQTAAGNEQAARNALRLFGKTDAQMNAIVRTRKIDNELRIVSPFAGHVTQRAVAPGALVQPGNTSAPFTIADLSHRWMVAYVAEDEVAALRVGQSVTATVAALPGRTLQGSIIQIGSAVDADTHRVAVRADIRDAPRELRAQMLAVFRMSTGEPMRSAGVPNDAIVREGDGTMTVFSTTDDRRFVRREVKLGLQQEGLTQIVDGLSAGERVAGEGALFLSNALALQAQ
ncbi:MAG: efflux RND transporter periplasmic adaptor subunit [Rhodanobacter sp.]|nr:efflux RND transporter periplasmic adaptor subunit [Rhodanobacter sp.]